MPVLIPDASIPQIRPAGLKQAQIFLDRVHYFSVHFHRYRNSNANTFQEEYHMKVSPLGDRVLIKVQEGDTKTAGGIIIPQTAQEKTQTGLVIAIGTDTDVIKVKKNDKVMYDKYAGTQIKIDGTDHLIVKFSDILAILE
jgi:chaperonin GroES